MSASERLRELLGDQQREGRFPVFPGDDVVLAALPELAAVVKAAEKLDDEYEKWRTDASDGTYALWSEHALQDALYVSRLTLAALDEKLEGRAKVDTNEKARRLGYDSLDAYLQDLYDGDGLDKQLGGGK